MVSWVHTYLQTDRVVYIKYVQLLIWQLYFKKVALKMLSLSYKILIKVTNWLLLLWQWRCFAWGHLVIKQALEEEVNSFKGVLLFSLC